MTKLSIGWSKMYENPVYMRTASWIASEVLIYRLWVLIPQRCPVLR